jgi:hypothetical protein
MIQGTISLILLLAVAWGCRALFRTMVAVIAWLRGGRGGSPPPTGMVADARRGAWR